MKGEPNSPEQFGSGGNLLGQFDLEFYLGAALNPKYNCFGGSCPSLFLGSNVKYIIVQL